MSSKFAAADPSPPADGPGLHSYAGAADPATPEAAAADLWQAVAEPTQEAEAG
jgi:hypothetical protein